MIFLSTQRLKQNLKWIRAIVFIQKNEKQENMFSVLCIWKLTGILKRIHAVNFFFAKKETKQSVIRNFFSNYILLYQMCEVGIKSIVHLKCWQLNMCGGCLLTCYIIVGTSLPFAVWAYGQLVLWHGELEL